MKRLSRPYLDTDSSWFSNLLPGLVIWSFRSAFCQYISFNVKLFSVGINRSAGVYDKWPTLITSVILCTACCYRIWITLIKPVPVLQLCTGTCLPFCEYQMDPVTHCLITHTRTNAHPHKSARHDVCTYECMQLSCKGTYTHPYMYTHTPHAQTYALARAHIHISRNTQHSHTEAHTDFTLPSRYITSSHVTTRHVTTRHVTLLLATSRLANSDIIPLP